MVDNSNSLYTASKDSTASFTRSQNVLLLKGIIWDNIEDTWPSRTHTTQFLGAISGDLYRDYIKANRSNFGVYKTAQLAGEAVWRTLVTNKEDEWTFNEAPGHWAATYTVWVNDEGVRQGRDHFRIAMAQYLFRNFVISRKGYFGLAPRKTLPGDKICVILGCSVPVVLRKVDKGYRLIGDIYVHGIMKGEVMSELEKGNVELEDICLV
jgi:hypothetical protein